MPFPSCLCSHRRRNSPICWTRGSRGTCARCAANRRWWKRSASRCSRRARRVPRRCALFRISSWSTGSPAAARSFRSSALAQEFAKQGEPTLLIDADFRAPSLHARFGLRNRLGLADLLDGGEVQMAACRENLALLVAGSVRQDPLELLSRERLRDFLAAAARPFRVVLVDTP